MYCRLTIVDCRLRRTMGWSVHNRFTLATRKSTIAHRQLGGVICLVSFVVAGCHRPLRAPDNRQDTSALSDMAFLHYLAGAPTVTVKEGMRAMNLLAQEDHRAFVDWKRWNLDEDSVLDKGTFAFMLRSVCDLPRGFNEVVLAKGLGLGARRYAMKTCIYEGLMPYGRASEPITGGELLSVLSAAENNKLCRIETNAEFDGLRSVQPDNSHEATVHD